jgi:hypothetical protein
VRGADPVGGEAGVRAWEPDERRALDRAPLIRIAAARSDGSVGRFATIGHVRVGDAELVRSLRGVDGAWYRGALRSGRAEIDVGGLHIGVAVTPASEPPEDVDAAFRARYGDDAGVRAMTRPPARDSTLLLRPLGVED